MRSRTLPMLCAMAAFAGVAAAQDISGTILFKKRLTKPRVTAPVSVYQRGAAVGLGKDAVEDPIALELSHVVVYIEGAGAGDEDPSDHATARIAQLNRRFAPDFVVVPAGSSVAFANMDPIFHNVYSLSKAKSFDLGNYDQGRSREIAFPTAGFVQVYCHLHPNMTATVVVTPNRWFAQPDRSGHYRIPHVPPGTYTLVAWHRTAGFFHKEIVVQQDRDTLADFFIPVDVGPRPQGELKASAGSR